MPDSTHHQSNPQSQNSDSEYLKQQVANLLKVMLAMTSIANQIIDPLTVEAAKKLKDWPEWETFIKKELDIHKRLRTRELIMPPLNAI